MSWNILNNQLCCVWNSYDSLGWEPLLLMSVPPCIYWPDGQSCNTMVFSDL